MQHRILSLQRTFLQEILPDEVIQSIVVRRPQISAERQRQPAQKIYQIYIGGLHMPVLQVVHIKAGHHMAHAQPRQFLQCLLQMLERSDAGNRQDGLPSEEMDDVRFHITFDQVNTLPNGAGHVTPVFRARTVQLIHAGKGEEFPALFHFLVQSDMDALDAAQPVPAWDHNTPQIDRHGPASILIPIKPRDTEQIISLVHQGFCQCVEAHDRSCAIFQAIQLQGQKPSA